MTDPFPSLRKFTGRELDPLTGQNQFRARFYDQEIGRFVSEDPMGFNGGDVNLFAYVANRPVMFRDPSGLTGTAAWPSPEYWRWLQAVQAALAGAGGAVAALGSSPVVVAGVGLGAGVAIGLPIGIYTANHPSNPFVNGPWNPWGNPHPTTPPLPPSLVRPPTGTVCQPRPRAVPWTRAPAMPFESDPDDDPDDRKCDEQLKADQAVCSSIADPQMKGACFAHAFDRWASFNAGRNIPYNPWPHYPWD